MAEKPEENHLAKKRKGKKTYGNHVFVNFWALLKIQVAKFKIEVLKWANQDFLMFWVSH